MAIQLLTNDNEDGSLWTRGTAAWPDSPTVRPPPAGTQPWKCVSVHNGMTIRRQCERGAITERATSSQTPAPHCRATRADEEASHVNAQAPAFPSATRGASAHAGDAHFRRLRISGLGGAPATICACVFPASRRPGRAMTPTNSCLMTPFE